MEAKEHDSAAEAHGRWLSIGDARRYAGNISRSTLTRLLRKGAVRGARVGGRTLVSQGSLDAYLLEHDYDSEANSVRD